MTMQAMKRIAVLLVIGLCQLTASADDRVIPLMQGEQFWGGCVTDGRAMPFGVTSFERDLYGDTRRNQAQPLLISNQGRYVWCEEPFKFTFADHRLIVQSDNGVIQFGKVGDSLRDAYQYVSRTYFPSTGAMPHEMLFVKPQYNTWIELIYDQREDRIRRYADDILANGFPAGVLMIDDNWRDLQQLIPDALAQGLMGYAFMCPDMIGGGEYSFFYNNPDKPLDQELIVRSAQCSALMPMMQFSVAPWRVLSAENMTICRDMARLHEKMGA